MRRLGFILLAILALDLVGCSPSPELPPNFTPPSTLISKEEFPYLVSSNGSRFSVKEYRVLSSGDLEVDGPYWSMLDWKWGLGYHNSIIMVVTKPWSLERR